jgi:two-component system, sensor histidine kinase and response regulator
MDTSKVFDLEGVMARLDGDHQLYREVVQLFLDGFPKNMALLREARAAKDGPAFGRTAHAIKGALGNIGAMRGWSKAFELEQAGKNNTFLEAPTLIEELEQEVSAFTVEYNKYLAKQ